MDLNCDNIEDIPSTNRTLNRPKPVDQYEIEKIKLRGVL